MADQRSTSFSGFPGEVQSFLTDLSRNNTKKWFDAHRRDYDEYVMATARLFVPAARDALRAIVPGIEGEPKVNASIRRIQRDTRFSKDTSPYKDHLDFYFWEGDKRRAVSGLYLRILPDRIGIGSGAHGFDTSTLHAFRDCVFDKQTGASLLRAVKATEAAGYAVRGYASREPHVSLIRRGGRMVAGGHHVKAVPWQSNQAPSRRAASRSNLEGLIAVQVIGVECRGIL